MTAELTTMKLTDWLAHVPAEGWYPSCPLLKFSPSTSHPEELPSRSLCLLSHPCPRALYIPEWYEECQPPQIQLSNLDFPAAPPPSDAVAVDSPQGTVPDPYTFAMSKVKPTQLSGGSVKIVDSTTFKASCEISVLFLHAQF